jgi:sec-independent protein translocase protein TatA
MLHMITLSFSTSPLAIGMPSGFEWLIIMGFGLLIFGKRLPEVGRSLGKGIVEFKKGLKGVEDDISQVDEQPAPQPRIQSSSSTPTPASRSLRAPPRTEAPTPERLEDAGDLPIFTAILIASLPPASL